MAVPYLVHATGYRPAGDQPPTAPSAEAALFARQLALADVVLLNKTDLLPPDSLEPVLPLLSAPPLQFAPNAVEYMKRTLGMRVRVTASAQSSAIRFGGCSHST